MDERTVRTVLLVGTALYVAGVLDDVFGDGKPPGGNPTPAPDDPRPATLTEQQAMGMADALEVAFWGDGLIVRPWEQDAAAAAILARCMVTADVMLLLNAYGERGTVLSPMGLAATVSDYLDADYMAEVNALYRSRNIAWQW